MIYKTVFKCLLIALCCMACTVQKNVQTLTILHTNDTHSQVEPLEEGKRDAFCAGYARRMGMVEQIRKTNPNLILLDAGDYSQGTPYFNFYHGRIEIDAMNRMHYDAITLGNHEFDYGVDTLATILKMAKFPIVCANYDVTGSALDSLVKPYTIITRGELRIGVFGLGIDPSGLISEKNFFPLRYLDPVNAAQNVADKLKNEENCHLVICLSHQGTDPSTEGKISDTELANETRNIDIIIGAHTHKVVENRYVKNLDGKDVLLTQVGKSGARIGEIIVQIGK